MKKETGLMFKAPLVRAILEGRKIQTRRILKPQPAPNHPHDGGTKWVLQRGLHVPVGSVGHLSVREKMGLCCPMGKPGDRIYVRETWQHVNFPLGPYQEGAPVFYRADYLHESDPDYADAERTIRRNWLPSIHMPKHAARIWLEITGVRVERLQQITEADCIAEGAPGGHGSIPGYPYSATPLEHFRHIWESTGGDWAANPWVWLIDFKTISTTGRPA
jgi:hypothetical protein